MRAVWITKAGGPEVLEVRESPDPQPKRGEVRIAVRAAGLNFAEVMARQGLYPDAPKPPCVVGYEVAGVIDALGGGVGAEWEGRAVLALTRFTGYADTVVAPLGQVFEKPAGLSFEQAAAIPVNYITAWQLMVVMGALSAGETVLIHNAGGGVGLAAIDIGRHLGATLIGTASAGKHDFLRELGVDEPIDYHDESATASDVDVYFGLVGEDSDLRWLPAIKEGGLLIGVPSGVGDRVEKTAAERNVRTSRILVEPDRGGLTGLVGLIEAGRLKVRVEQTFPLEDAAKAHELGESGRVSGKLVLTV